MYVIYWERSIRKASWMDHSDRATIVVGVVKGGIDEVISYMDSAIEDDIKTYLNNWSICYTNANVNPKRLTFTTLRRSKDNKDSMMVRYTAVETHYLN